MENLGQFKKWLQSELENINLEMNLQGNYIIALVSDNLNTTQGKIDIVSELLCCSLPSAPPSSSELEALAKEIVENYDGMKQGKGKKEKEKAGKKSAFDDLGNLSKHLKKEGEGEKKKESKESAEERKKRQMLLMNYGYEEEVEGEDGEEDDDDFVNDNAQRVREAADAVRVQNKVAHDAKVAKDKENLAADKARKEEKKSARKTVKQERKRM